MNAPRSTSRRTYDVVLYGATGFVGQAARTNRGVASGTYLSCYFLGGLVGSAVLADDAKKLIAKNGGDVMIREGTISLQSESHPIEFRKVEILPLDK